MEELKMFTVEEVAEMFRVSTKTILNYIREEKILAIKLGTAWRISETSVQAFIEKNSNIKGDK